MNSPLDISIIEHFFRNRNIPAFRQIPKDWLARDLARRFSRAESHRGILQLKELLDSIQCKLDFVPQFLL